MTTVIRVENVSKQYRLGEVGTGTLSHDINRWWHRVRGKEDPYLKIGENNDRSTKGGSDYAWALRDVSFEVNQGEVLGIIGKNGAGKSTLLKILSRVTTPTTGEIKAKGRIASLLEVGTGFHPELTGRENVYLNGAILGMRKHEISAKFDEIVQFSGCERYIDTPVKRYSSGMYVRLAFAVAAHLDPEILIVDEVLAVGDAEFQRKCVGKMKDVAGLGRTVIFVSHNMGTIQSLCTSGMVIENGQISFVGKASDAVAFDQRKSLIRSEATLADATNRSGTGEMRILSVRLEDDGGNLQHVFRMGESLNLIMRVVFFKEITDPIIGFNLIAETGVMVADCRSIHGGLKFGRVAGEVEFRGRISPLQIYPRTYSIEPWATDTICVSVFDWVHDAVKFEVTSGPNFLSGANVNSNHGIIHIPTMWKRGDT